MQNDEWNRPGGLRPRRPVGKSCDGSRDYSSYFNCIQTAQGSSWFSIVPRLA